MRNIQGRPPLTSTVQQWNATQAGDLIGERSQTVADGQAVAPIEADPEANLYVSLEDTNSVELLAAPLQDEGTALVVRIVKQLGSQSVLVTAAGTDTIEGNAAVELDAPGSAATLVPYANGDGTYQWLLGSTLGTVTLIP